MSPDNDTCGESHSETSVSQVEDSDPEADYRLIDEGTPYIDGVQDKDTDNLRINSLISTTRAANNARHAAGVLGTRLDPPRIRTIIIYWFICSF